MKPSIIILLGILIIFGGFIIYRNNQQFPLPEGESMPADSPDLNSANNSQNINGEEKNMIKDTNQNLRGQSNRKILVTDGIKHSIPLEEILSGGPPKDGIPSIDNPKFVTLAEANQFLSDKEVGLGLTIKDESRFYPNQIMVWHEIINDTIQDQPTLITYCPLCATGIVFERKLDGQPVEFGVSGRLWQSNLLMYNRSAEESLWSQVLGEAVLGTHTGQRLNIIPSDIVQYGEWKKAHPDTKVLSRDTGAIRSYGVDPYGDYYTNTDVGFGAEFTDNRLRPKDLVLGVEYSGQFKAYLKETLPVGETKDKFASQTITINKTANQEINMTINGQNLPYIEGFWFSWAAVHPNTDIYK